MTLETLGTQCRWQEDMMFFAAVMFTAVYLGLVQILLDRVYLKIGLFYPLWSFLLKQDLM